MGKNTRKNPSSAFMNVLDELAKALTEKDADKGAEELFKDAFTVKGTGRQGQKWHSTKH